MHVYIQAVDSRLPFINSMMIPAIRKTGCLFEPVVMVDTERRGPAWNAKRIWRAIAESGVPGLCLQDDVILHKDFGKVFPAISGHVHQGTMKAVSLFAPPRKIMAEAYRAGHNFVENYDFLWLQAIVLTPEFCAGLYQYAELHESIHDDTILGEYSRKAGLPVWNTLPSLVQHDLNVKSTMGTGRSCGGVKRRTILWEKELPEDVFETIHSTRNGRPAK